MGGSLKKSKGAPASAGAYFAQPTDLKFTSSGCTLLDCVLGGGWVLGRMSNIIGDKSTAKTGIAIESCANFARKFPKGGIYYREAEAAFDKPYAASIGMPLKRVNFWEDDYDAEKHPLETVEDLFEDLDKVVSNERRPSLYVVDSLDALSDREELKREIDKGSYSLEKQKRLGQLFRRLVRKIENAQICLLIISQVRDNIGVSFGKKHRRVGGKAMDFYASHCLWLSHVETINRTQNKIKRATGIMVRAKCEKNKVSLPFREATFEYKLGYGIDNLAASLTWLDEVGRLESAIGTKDLDKFLKLVEKMPEDQYREMDRDVSEVVRDVWREVELSFLPTRRKYG